MPSLTGILLCIVGSVHNMYVAQAALFLVGLNNVLFFTAANVHLQHESATEHQGRIMSIFIFCFQGMTPVGNMLAGSLIPFSGPGLALVLLGICSSVLDLASQLAFHVFHRRDPASDA
jgi:hypothetical protein